MKLNFKNIISLAILFQISGFVSATIWKAYLGSFAVKTNINQKVKKAALWDGKGASVIQCTQQCAARDECYGFNLCGNYCDLFKKTEFSDGLVSSDTCTVYLLTKTICKPNPCENDGLCKVISADEYKCECKDVRRFDGKHCDIDNAFKIVFKSQSIRNSLVFPVPREAIQSFTICILFNLYDSSSSHYKNVFTYHSNDAKTQPCSEIGLDVNAEDTRLTYFDQHFEMKSLILLKNIPVRMCIVYDYDKGNMHVYRYAPLKKELTISPGKYKLSTPGTITFGNGLKNNTALCLFNKSDKECYDAEISYFYMFRYVLTPESITRYIKEDFDTSEAFIRFGDILKKEYLHGNVVIKRNI